MTPDSHVQYAMAVSGQYSDHHPFIMSFLWRQLDYLYKGPGLMLTFHLSLLWGSVFYLYKSLRPYPWRPLVLLIPFIPNIWVYENMIWKDVGCAFAYLGVLSFMAYACLQKIKINIFALLILLLLLTYGTLVKFQAAFLAPIALVWIAWHAADYQGLKRFVFPFIAIAAVFYSILSGVLWMGPKVTPDHSWQFVKLYDLAAISVGTNENLFPKANETNLFSMKELHQRFNHQRVDDMIFTNPILQKGKTDDERSALYNTWLHQVLKHPFIYFRHRLSNLAYIVLSIPDFEHITSFIHQHTEGNPLLEKNLIRIARIPGTLFLAHIATLFLGVIYFCLSVISFLKRREEIAAIPLFFMNTIALALVSVLLFCSMAGTPRYTYLSIVLIHASHGFAYICWRTLRQKVSRS